METRSSEDEAKLIVAVSEAAGEGIELLEKERDRGAGAVVAERVLFPFLEDQVMLSTD